MWYFLVVLVNVTITVFAQSEVYEDTRKISGYPAGFLPKCPGAFKNATFTKKSLQELQVVIHQVINGEVYTRSYPIRTAAKFVAKDPNINLVKRKTVVYATGFFDSSSFIQTKALGTAYALRGYNVLLLQTFNLLTHAYPKLPALLLAKVTRERKLQAQLSVRLTKPIGKEVGDFLVNLTPYGLENSNLELVGLSLGAHVASFAAKRFRALTGNTPYRLTGLDPAGPCFRNLPSSLRFDASDAQNVDAIHTNIDGFGMARPLGHVDFYVNGGEYQPSDIPSIPCLIICSHFRSIIYWWLGVSNPKQFVAASCDTVQSARDAKCFNQKRTINYMGLETNFTRPGIYYLATSNEFPYYMSKKGLLEENETFNRFLRDWNKENVFEV